jgi:hypothetical protein
MGGSAVPNSFLGGSSVICRKANQAQLKPGCIVPEAVGDRVGRRAGIRRRVWVRLFFLSI